MKAIHKAVKAKMVKNVKPLMQSSNRMMQNNTPCGIKQDWKGVAYITGRNKQESILLYEIPCVKATDEEVKEQIHFIRTGKYLMAHHQ